MIISRRSSTNPTTANTVAGERQWTTTLLSSMEETRRGGRGKRWISLASTLICLLFVAQNIHLYYWNNNNGSRSDREVMVMMDRPLRWEGPPMSCVEISKLTIVRKLGEGKHKVAYEVQLTNGALAVAKRCKSLNCMRFERLAGEADKNQLYQTRGVQGLVAIYGSCYRPYASTNPRYYDLTNLSVGHTVIYEKGQVLMKNWGEMYCHACLARFFTEADVEDLRRLARSYSTAGILLQDLDEKHDTDNIYPTQYILTPDGIRHADLDRTNDCVPNNKGCPEDEAGILEANCQVLVGGVARRDNPNCSLTYSVDHPVADPTRHIDIAKARRRCLMDFFGFWLKSLLEN